jgi:hypothetical protein
LKQRTTQDVRLVQHNVSQLFLLLHPHITNVSQLDAQVVQCHLWGR